ncbi:hypothetical protein NC653_004407 [Populus alba x Populus x berolinensis]|uniref:Uncharacterized protein n=1 Tax=Populus alba x Populus x berolinensis TaxID=444605 RepID=A0AAD6WKH7_9ROSI|nr:hypothetical protein NC653_004407 [Populus alba x Populus x berolinensis]
MKGYWYFLEVFKESKKRIGPHTDHYNCIFVLIVRSTAEEDEVLESKLYFYRKTIYQIDVWTSEFASESYATFQTCS